MNSPVSSHSGGRVLIEEDEEEGETLEEKPFVCTVRGESGLLINVAYDGPQFSSSVTSTAEADTCSEATTPFTDWRHRDRKASGCLSPPH